MSTGPRHREINQRPKLCPVCLLFFQAGNLARHRRRHEPNVAYPSRANNVLKRCGGCGRVVRGAKVSEHRRACLRGPSEVGTLPFREVA